MNAKEKTNNINTKDELMKMIITIEKIASFIMFGYFVLYCFWINSKKHEKNCRIFRKKKENFK